ncbi:MAG TPA: hypothetical protein PKZ12_07560 [Smithellaceae bacterium]|nr:hypothetical protein [Smithellaceae bacterium]
MEYLLVDYPAHREVLVDKEAQGNTNEIIELEKGTHIISLKAPPYDFRPRRRKIVLQETSPLTPREVTFVEL